MQVTGNTILITGGGSGIGRALAEAFHRRGNEVIIAGRREHALREVAEANPGMKTAVLDLQSPEDIERFAARMAEAFPKLNAVLNNAGIMQMENWRADKVDLATAEATIATNLLAPIRLTAALLPQLKRQPKSTVLTVSSGLAFLTLAHTPTYSATKAAIHAFSDALRYQLRDTSVDVIEIAPPYVATELMGESQANDPNAMPLAEFIEEVMSILETQPNAREVLVKRVYPLRFAAEQGYEKYMEQFHTFNDRFGAGSH
ncbi:SDR family oxidoreductase [Trinickia soli]|uniref:Oxidoreductase n=1 Tax=Trinickia soli TaxID=380675 RepID=A0A2N7VKU8_9BURK|nr:SDR family oxidoreductase [Trinickia soli]KAA0078783.1 SDR family NAD(P)-dependent oxidoreductase [Paraburkholderia sp. T12-10]PMS17790.1 oxidoreductase [Trinickia soli]CAB3723756.1 putative oxidoreductase [Trinickia soli]